MLVPALFLARGALLVTAGQPVGYVDLAFMVYRLGPPLLARECRAVFGLDYTTRLLRIVGGALGVFAAFGLMRGAANLFFIDVATFAGLLSLTSVLLAHASRLHGDLFAGTDSEAA